MFKASVNESESKEAAEVKTVKIVKTVRYAGETITSVPFLSEGRGVIVITIHNSQSNTRRPRRLRGRQRLAAVPRGSRPAERSS
jgi:hypothetical protein